MTGMAAAADVASAQAPGHAVRTGQVLAIAPQPLGLDAKAMQPQPLPCQRLHDGADLLGTLPTADRADTDQRLRGQVDPGRLVHGGTRQVIGQLPALKYRYERQIGRQFLELQIVVDFSERSWIRVVGDLRCNVAGSARDVSGRGGEVTRVGRTSSCSCGSGSWALPG